MGIQNFTKLFTPQGEVKYKDYRNKWIAIDAMYQLHRTAHPFKTTKSAILMAPDGTATNHINGLLALILNLKKAAIHQIWIFDHPDGGHDSLKDIEVERRRTCRALAKKKLASLNNTVSIPKAIPIEDPTLVLFSDSDTEEKSELEDTHAINRNKYERAAFSLEIYMINDLKYILDCFGVTWMEAPKGFEAEQVAAYMTTKSIGGITVSAVLTPDPDCLLFGARQMLKNDKQKLFLYDLAKLLKDVKITQNDLIKIGVVLGCDFAEKTAGIGPKTVLKKISSITLTARQQEAINYFAKPICEASLFSIHIHGKNITPFADTSKITELVKWLTTIKGFNSGRIESRLKNAKIELH